MVSATATTTATKTHQASSSQTSAPGGVLRLRPEPTSAASIEEDASSASDRPMNSEPLKYGGSFDGYEQFDLTPVIGREFTSDLQLTSILDAPNAEELARDLSVLVSRRGVCFFRSQNMTGEQMTRLGLLMKNASGCPTRSGLHVHPLTEDSPELMGRNGGGGQVAEISSEKQKKGGGLRMAYDDKSTYASTGWHSDITFENVPSSYAMLKIHTLPATGGDTLWASAYEAYDRLSQPMRSFLETLTATHDANFFHDEARRLGIPIKAKGRGHPSNEGEDLRAVHPVIRTNPVTGWKGLFVNYAFTKRINGVTRDENDFIMKYCNDLVSQNHDLQVRFRWTKDTVAIWDNRSTFHTATYDYEAARAGERVCACGERPYLDTERSGSRKEELAKEGKEW